MNKLGSKQASDRSNRLYEVNAMRGAQRCHRIGLNGSYDLARSASNVHNNKSPGATPAYGVAGMTLVELIVALAISSLAIGGIVSGYLFSINAAEKSALSLAASARATQCLEETRAAKWDLSSWPSVDQLVATNFPDKVVILDLNGTGNEITYATNVTSISQISQNPPLKAIHVDCVWSFKGGLLVTNSVETCRAPDQ